MSEIAPQKRKNTYAVAFALLGELAIEIAVPAVVFTMIGKRIDTAYGTSPKILIASFVLAFVVSATIVWKRAQAMKKLYLSNTL